MDDGILLGVRMEHQIHEALEKLPEHPDGHGKAKGHNGQKEGREVKDDALVAVEQHRQGKADGCRQEAVGGVKHGVPMGHTNVEGSQLAQDLRREDKAQNDALQHRRQLDAQLHLDQAGQVQQRQGQGAEEHALIVAQEGLAHQDHQHQGAEGPKDQKGALVLPQLLGHSLF